MALVIPISGKAQHGKDTTAKILKDKLIHFDNRVLIVHYADYLKFVCKEYFNWNGKKDEEGRSLLQYIGTDKARKNNPNIWVKVISEFIKAIEEDYDYILIPDTRFPNEIEYLKKEHKNVLSIRINREKFESSLTQEQKLHLSEIALDKYKFDYFINYENGLDKVNKAVDLFVNEVLVVNNEK